MHLFYCHSAITALVAAAVIAKLRIPAKDVHILWGRSYSWQALAYASTDLPLELSELSDLPSYGCRNLTRRHGQKVEALDRLLADSAGGDAFTAYLPNTRNFLMQACATHPDAAGLHFLEEGLMSYAGTYEKPTSPAYRGLIGTARRWGKRSWHGGRSYFYRPMRFAQPPVLFTINPRVEHHASARQVVVAPLQALAHGESWEHDARHVFVFDVIVEFGYCDETALLAVFRHFLIDLFNRREKLVVRFHPAQKINARIIGVLEQCGVHYAVDRGSIPLELVIAQKRDLTLYGFHSSLLFYAKVSGLQAHSLAKLLAAADPRARKWYEDTVPAVFYQVLSFYEG